MSPAKRNRGFTLIEVLVVVAIIALLISILIPSLNAARKQARMVACQANLRSLMLGFLTYASETKGFLPGLSEDHEADWLGLGNTNKLTGQGPGSGRNPEDGTVFKYVGKQTQVYRCPDDDPYRKSATTANRNYSYTTCTLLSGANTANVGQAHYRYAGSGVAGNYSEFDHTANMRASVAMVIVEEDIDWYIEGCNNSAWDNDDGITDRHLRRRGDVACIDGHVEAVSLPATPRVEGKYFGSRRQCVRYKNKWVSGTEWYSEFYWDATGGKGAYRGIERCKPASAYGVKHAGDP
jgi:prepilin-type N-terminal cleavage/methylation domain-containing protein